MGWGCVPPLPVVSGDMKLDKNEFHEFAKVVLSRGGDR
jgi:hypothetical protein